MKQLTRPAMISGWLLYLAAATGCQAAFALLYWLGLASLNTFGWNRAYLLSALVLSLLLPLLALPAAWAHLLWPAATVAVGGSLPGWQLAAASRAAGPAAAPAMGVPWLAFALAAYWLGVAARVWGTARSLAWLYRLSRRHPRTRLGSGWLVQLPEPSRPAFSFGKLVFLSPAHAQLSAPEYAQLVQHEQVHGAQHHTFDLLLAEVIGWFFWFNGLVAYLSRQLRTVHEYLADAAVARPAGSCLAYGRLLLKLAAGPLPAALVHPFATRQVALRLHMLTHPSSSPMKKLRFLLVVPVFALAWVGALALNPSAAPTGFSALAQQPASRQRIGSIAWQGNKMLSSSQLNQALGLKPGDPYDATTVATHLASRADAQDITSRYMDHGYLFFSINAVPLAHPDGTTDLTFVISEGRPAQLGTITVAGNHKVPTETILAMLPLHPGDLFSRAKLLQAQQLLAQDGAFDPTHVNVNPQPVARPKAPTDLVNLVVSVTEK